jgi:rRNA maturation RNase YbeY
VEGEIYISVERVKSNAEQFTNSLTDELHRVLIHGALHLCGYKDKTVKDKSATGKGEEFYLSLRKF